MEGWCLLPPFQGEGQYGWSINFQGHPDRERGAQTLSPHSSQTFDSRGGSEVIAFPDRRSTQNDSELCGTFLGGSTTTCRNLKTFHSCDLLRPQIRLLQGATVYGGSRSAWIQWRLHGRGCGSGYLNPTFCSHRLEGKSVSAGHHSRQEVFSGTWNTIKVACAHEQPLMQSTRGTRPGDPVADLTFTCVMQTILSRFLTAGAELLPSLPSKEGDQRVPPITWVDDVAIFLETEQADQIIPRVRRVVELMYRLCRAYGLDLNFAPGKTEVLLRFHGRNATRLRKTVFQEKFLPINAEHDKILLSATSQYTHLGIKHTATLSFEAEFSFRFSRARQALAECRKKILCNRAIPCTTRWNLARSLVLSRLFFACELWPPLTDRQQKSLQAFLTKVGRIILGMENYADSKHTTDDEVNAKLMIPSVDSLLCTARLRYLARMVCYAPKILLLVLQRMEFVDENAWFTRVRYDVQWLQQRVQRFHHLPDPFINWDVWMSQLIDVREWAASANSALQADITHRHLMARYRVWRLQVQENLFHLGMKLQEEAPAAVPMNSVCQQCGKGFGDNKALSVHMYKVHGQQASVRSYMDSTTCGACLKDFHTVQKLRQHLQYKRGRCLQILQNLWFPFETDDLQGFTPSAEVKHAHRLPALQCCGPLLPDREVWQLGRPLKQFPPRNQPIPESHTQGNVEQTASPENIIPPEEHALPGPQTELFMHLVEYARTAMLPFEPPPWDVQVASAFEDLVAFGECLQEELISHLDPQLYIEIVWWFESVLAEHFRMQRDPVIPQQKGSHPPKLQRHLPCSTGPEWLQDLQRPVVAPPCPVPREPSQDFPTKYILHVYAGHRRDGDVIEWTQHFNAKFATNVVMVTVDIVYEADLCDMRADGAKSFWIRAIPEGFFAAILGAPPCETWSAARFRAVLLDDGGPKPLRSQAEPSGLQNGSWRNQKQILVANDLLQVWISMMVAAAFSNTAFIMEHPAPSKYVAEAPSVWKLAESSLAGTFAACTAPFGIPRFLRGSVS